MPFELPLNFEDYFISRRAMSKPSVKLPFGFRTSDGRLVDVLSVPNGKRCGCICPECKREIVARNNPTNAKVPHFAHSADCVTAYETVIHEAAKQILRDVGWVWLPASIIAPRTKFVFTNHTLEKRYDRLVPDVTVWNNDKDRLALEIYVTHEVGPEKQLRLKRLQLSCVEFDLSKLPREINYEQLKMMFLEDKIMARWVYNRRARLEEIRLMREAQRRRSEILAHNRRVAIEARQEAKERLVHIRKNSYGYPIYHVDPCPKGVRRGGLANVNLDCKECDFCFGINLQNHVPVKVLCGGHKSYLIRSLDKRDIDQPRESGLVLLG
jgi:hypothetical protein